MAPDAIPMLATSPTSLLPAISELLGWTYFLCWATSSYPQPIINYQRRSVTGLSIDYFLLNILGHTCYTLTTLSFLYIPLIRTQYTQRFGPSIGPPTVRVNDLAFTSHALFWSCLTYTQFHLWGYRRLPTQRISAWMTLLILTCILSILLTILLVAISPATTDPLTGAYLAGWQWLDVVYFIGDVKLLTTLVKYFPQAYLNYRNKSTRGWSIHKCALDFAGSLGSLVQLGIDAGLTPGGWRSVVGNPLKFWLGLVSVGFDVVFGLQHWVLYPDGGVKRGEGEEEEEEDGVGRGRGVGQEEVEEARGLLAGEVEVEREVVGSGGVYGSIPHIDAGK